MITFKQPRALDNDLTDNRIHTKVWEGEMAVKGLAGEAFGRR